MTIENVNGTPRQVFMLGAGKYYAPVELGSGYRKALEREKMRVALGTDVYNDIMAQSLAEKLKPRGLPDEAWQQQVAEQMYPRIQAAVQVMQPEEIELAILEVLLTPAPGSASVRVAYYEHSTDEQVQAVVNFSTGLVTSKTATASSRRTSGKTTKRKAGGR